MIVQVVAAYPGMIGFSCQRSSSALLVDVSCITPGMPDLD